MSEVVNRIQPPMNSAVMATWYRTLGLCSLYIPIQDVVSFIKAPDNPYGGEANKVFKVGPYEYWEWKDISVSKQEANDPIKFTSYLFGGPQNTAFMRNDWYYGHVLDDKPPETDIVGGPPVRGTYGEIRNVMRKQMMDSSLLKGNSES